ncbi:hypothetical protein [Noviherbaspirillum pedocola]|uniref:Porin n=1 Tax=Noviherbaspirillum pedocola TaxID=2801341 RepID=A0A934T064_9BURK|nr:hypothetical protein [Noviherbaspirillum pedocola]MBK4738934.1 hypothetical protein [Noviherbaspirillum pedocola]
MLKRRLMAAAIAVAFAPLPALAASKDDIAQLRAEMRRMKAEYESRIGALEQRLQQAEAKAATPSSVAASPAPVPSAAPGTQAVAQSTPAAPAAPATTVAPAASSSTAAAILAASAMPAQPAAMPASAAGANAFNPAISAILGGTYANLSRDPKQYRLQGFMPGGEDIGPGSRSFSLGESEVALSANIDPTFSGQLIFALAGDNSVSVEEAFVQTKGLANGLNLKAGRMLAGVGYLNSIHAHAWDFVDAPLAYQAFFGGQYRNDGLQLKWLAPTERYLELGFEAGNGGAFPGNDRNKNGFGSAALYAHIGDDIGESASWRAGISFLHTGAKDRAYTDVDSSGAAVSNSFSGHANLVIVDGVYKWSPNGNATQTNFKLQGEYFRRRESGTLAFDTTGNGQTGAYASAQSGWYLQGVYQFMPAWRAGLRYDRLSSGTPDIGLVSSGALSAADFSQLSAYNPKRLSFMVDWSPSEFSRIRLQLAQDKSRPGTNDNEVFLQYIMSLGVHGAHTF